MGVLIDASVLIAYERGGLDVGEALGGRSDEFFLSVITASEMLHGVHRATEPRVRARRSAFVEAVLSSFPLLEIDVATARAHARLWADLASTGQLIGAHDLWLAASCLGHGLSLATANARHFTRVPGLDVEVWKA
jgi:tRNA(fMet)-specific endonuclease VapC